MASHRRERHGSAGADVAMDRRAAAPGPTVRRSPRSTGRLQRQAKRHLWMHFTRMGAYADAPTCRSSCAARAATSTTRTASATSTACRRCTASTSATGAPSSARRRPSRRELDFYTNWSYAHPRSIELATRIAGLAPGDLNRVFFTSGGSEAVESALKLAQGLPPRARRAHAPQADRARARLPRHVAGRADGDRPHAAAHAVRAARRPAAARGEHELLPLAGRARPAVGGRRDRGGDRVRGPRDRRRGDPRAGAERRRLLRAAGRLLPARARDLRPPRRAADLRRGDLLVGADRALFGCERYGYQPDIITTAKGITSAYAPMGAMIASDRIAEPFLQGKEIFAHGFTFGGHPMALRGRAREHRPDRARGPLRARAARTRASSARCSRACATSRSSATCAAPATSRRSSWSRTRRRRRPSTPQESEQLLRGFLSGALYQRGLICRTDDRGDPVVQLSPPLIADREQFAEIEAMLRPVLTEASASGS